MLIHKKLWAELGTLKRFFLPYFLKWKIYAKTLKLTSCWVSSNKIRFVKSMYRFWKNKPHQGIILSRMLRNWSKALELFCSQNGQISFQYCFKDYFVWSIRKTGHRIQYFCNLQDYHLDIYVFMYIINFSVIVKTWPWLSQYQQRTESGGSGAWRGTRQFSPVLYTSSAQGGFIQIISKEESVRKLKWVKSKIKPEEFDACISSKWIFVLQIPNIMLKAW